MATRKLTRDEAKKMTLLPFGKKHPVCSLIELLRSGELLFVDKKDFSWKKKTPTVFFKRISKKTGKHFNIWKNPEKTGWVVERVQ